MKRLHSAILSANLLMLLLLASNCRQTPTHESEAARPAPSVNVEQPEEEIAASAKSQEEIKEGSSEAQEEILETKGPDARPASEAKESGSTPNTGTKEDRSVPSAENRKEPPPPPPKTVVFTGVLVSENGEPVSGKNVTLHEAKDGGYSIQAGEGGVVQNPSDETDDQGRFKLVLDREVFKGATDFTITVPRMGWARAIEDENGAMIVVKIADKTRKFDFGKIVLR